jgi:hypothetical protein
MFEGPGGLVNRGRRLEELGVRYDVPGGYIEAVRRRGWRWELDRERVSFRISVDRPIKASMG